MTRLVIWTIVGVLIGVACHLTMVLALPHLATRSAAARLVDIKAGSGFHLLPPPASDAMPLPAADPAIRTAVCRYNLGAGPLHVVVPMTGSFLSVAFYTLDGLSFYALTDRAASNGAIDLKLYTGDQLAMARSREGPDTAQILRVGAPAATGLATIRALVREPSFNDTIEKQLRLARCEVLPPAG